MHPSTIELRLMHLGMEMVPVKIKKEWVLYQRSTKRRIADIYVDYEKEWVYHIYVDPLSETELFEEVEEALIAGVVNA